MRPNPRQMPAMASSSQSVNPKNVLQNEQPYKTEGFLKQAWSQPAGKVVLIGGGSVLLLLATGGAIRLLARVISGYNDFKDARNGK